jgi:hypothetical protein
MFNQKKSSGEHQDTDTASPSISVSRNHNHQIITSENNDMAIEKFYIGKILSQIEKLKII